MELFVDFFESTLSAALSSSATSLTLVDAALLPSPTGNDVFHVIIDREIIRISAKSGNALTVDTSGRGALGSAAAAHNAGALVFHGPVARNMVDLYDGQVLRWMQVEG